MTDRRSGAGGGCSRLAELLDEAVGRRAPAVWPKTVRTKPVFQDPDSNLKCTVAVPVRLTGPASWAVSGCDRPGRQFHGLTGLRILFDREAAGSLHILPIVFLAPVNRGLLSPLHCRCRYLLCRRRRVGPRVRVRLTLAGCLRHGRAWRRGRGLVQGSVRTAAVASVGRRRVAGRRCDARVLCVATATGSRKEMPCRGEVGRMVLVGGSKAGGGLDR